jgi:hypothetical protein
VTTGTGRRSLTQKKHHEQCRCIGVRFVGRGHSRPRGVEGHKHGAWVFKFDRGPESNKFKLDGLFAADALLLGRVTYQGFAKAWP